MIKLSDIARELGVSTATISNALTGKGRMKEETRQHIREAAKEMGYVIPHSARGKGKNILVITEANNITFSSEIASGLSAAARRANISCSLCDLTITLRGPGRDATPEQLRPLIDHAIALQEVEPGCVIYISQYPRSLPGLLENIECPAVEVFCQDTGAQCSVNYDDQQGVYQAVSHLIETGRRNIAMISGPVDNHFVNERMIGYQRALIDHGLSVHPKLMWIGDWEVVSGRELTHNLLLATNRPDAIFAQNDTMACGALQAIQEMGLRVPEDVAVVGFDNTVFCNWMQPTITSVAPPFFRMGEAAFEQAHALLCNDMPDKPSQRIPCSLCIRKSTVSE